MSLYKVFIIAVISFTINNAAGQSSNKSELSTAPFQGTKTYCSFLKPVKFIVTVRQNLVTIICNYKDESDTTTGKFINGKLYTNDVNEKKFHVAGKYYIINKEYLRINNLEGGDYNEYDVCK
jgi:hypothetical protein